MRITLSDKGKEDVKKLLQELTQISVLLTSIVVLLSTFFTALVHVVTIIEEKETYVEFYEKAGTVIIAVFGIGNVGLIAISAIYIIHPFIKWIRSNVIISETLKGKHL